MSKQLKNQIPLYAGNPIVVEKGIPIPPRADGRVSKYPYDLLKVGDSFMIETERRTTQLSACMTGWRKKTGFDFTCREEFNKKGVKIGLRIWRVK